MVLTVTVALLSGCASKQYTRFHVAVADMDQKDPEVKFYRVTIDANSLMVNSSLQTGFYDANAVRALYGEVSTNPPTEFKQRVGTHQFLFNPETRQWQPAPEDKLFTVVYGVSAKGITTAIETHAASAQAGDEIASLLAASAGRETYIEAIGAEQLQKDQRAKLVALSAKIAELSEKAKTLPTNAPPKEVYGLLIQAAQEAARQLGSSVTFDPNDLTNSLRKAEQLLEIVRNTPTNP